MGLKTGRTNGAKAFNEARANGVFAAAPSGLAIGKPANAGLGPAARIAPRPGVLHGNNPTLADQPANLSADDLRAGERAAYEQTWHHIANDYDDSCGMATRQEFARELLIAVFDDFLEMDIEINGWPVVRRGEAYTDQWDYRFVGFNSAAHIFLAALGVHRLHNNSKPIVTRAQSESHGSDSPATTPDIRIQDLQDKRDVQAVISGVAAKMSGSAQEFRERTSRPDDTPAPWDPEPQTAPGDSPSTAKRDPVTLEPEKTIDPVTEMNEALHYAVTHWNEADARKLPGKYQVYRSPGKPTSAKDLPDVGPYWIFKHADRADRIVVGMLDLKTKEPVYVARKEEIRAYMGKCEAGAKPKAEKPSGPASAPAQPAPVTVAEHIAVPAAVKPVAEGKVAVSTGLMFCLSDYPADWKRPAWLDLVNIGSDQQPRMVEGL